MLKDLIVTKFYNSEKCYGRYIEALRALGLQDGDALFDFGCSWGYGSYQLSHAGGYSVTAFDINRARSTFARDKLGVNVVDNFVSYCDNHNRKQRFDCFFSSHVLEHVPSPSDILDHSKSLLREGGIIVAITPNGSAAYRKNNSQYWHSAWGEKHPYLLDDTFYRSYFRNRRPLICSLPIGEVEAAAFLSDSGPVQNSLDGPELIVACRL